MYSRKPSRQGRLRPHHHDNSSRSQSRSRHPRRARSSSPQQLPHPLPRVPSPPSQLPPIHLGAIPHYVPSGVDHAHAIPSAVAYALHKQGEEYNEAIAAAQLGYRLPQGAGIDPQLPSAPPRRRPSASPGSIKARRRRRRPRRPRPPPRSIVSDREDSLPPPPPVPAFSNFPIAVSPPFFFSKVERDRRGEEEEEAQKKREREERRKEKEKEKERERRKREKEKEKKEKGRDKEERGRGRGGMGAGEDRKGEDGEDAGGGGGGGGVDVGISKRAKNGEAAETVNQVYHRGGERDRDRDDEPRADSRPGRRHHHTRHRRHHQKHSRRAGESHHRRQKKRSKTGMRNFFASLRRKLGELLRPAGVAGGTARVPAQFDGYMTPVRTKYQQSMSGVGSSQVSHPRRAATREEQTQAPYIMHGARSPRPSTPRSMMFFTTVAEPPVTMDPGPPSPPKSPPPPPPRRHTRADAPPRHPHGFTRVEEPTTEKESSKKTRGSRSSRSTISIFARRFVGPFLSETSEPPTPESGVGQRKINWRDRGLLTVGLPTTPESSRESSLGNRDQKGHEVQPDDPVPLPGSYPPVKSSSGSSLGIRGLHPSSPVHDRHSSSGSSWGIRALYPSSPDNGQHSSSGSSLGIRALYPPSPGHDRHSSSSSSLGIRALYPLFPSRDSSSGYGLDDLFETPPMVSSPVRRSPISLPSSDDGLQRFSASLPPSSSLSYGMHRLFGD
ncbi:hypothetical protein GGR50DRAFT_669771 [Xylaria sp. CBS 124048]|nr:hypothetical protein GGR50DRAFT_669771 [Xylaria sp. CBS 124048]